MAEVSCNIVESFDHIDKKTEAEWDRLTLATRGSIYLTCSWCRVWWECYSRDRPLRILFYYDENRLIAVLPLYIDPIYLGPVRVKAARFIGANNPMRVFDPPIMEERAASIAAHMADHFLRRERCDTISIGPFSDESASKTAFVASFRRMNDASVDFTEKPFGVYTYFTLPDSFEEYMVALAPKQKKHRVKYDLNAMSKEYSVRLDVLQDPEKVSSEFPGFLRLHTDQWRNEGKPGHFGAWPGSASFHRRLAAELAKQGRTRLIKVTADDTPIIYQYAYCFGDRCYWLLPARIIGKQWDRFSLGQKATVALIRCLIEEKIKHIEAGVSHYDYKSRLGAIESKISTLRLTSRRLGSRMKSSLLEKCFYAVNIVYYKIWYCRIQPRLPSRFHFPVWKAWIDLNV